MKDPTTAVRGFKALPGHINFSKTNIARGSNHHRSMNYAS
jgi:hypothetical protein